jgi:hypothetical protein
MNYDNPNSEGRQKLTKAFSLLRKNKVIARQNFSCCGTCGSYEISVMGEEKGKKTGTYPAGYVFYHRQDTDTLKRNGVVYLRYGSFENRNNKLRKGSLSSKEVGELIVSVMKEVGLETEWDGDTGHCVLVNVEGIKKEELR